MLLEDEWIAIFTAALSVEAGIPKHTVDVRLARTMYALVGELDPQEAAKDYWVAAGRDLRWIVSPDSE